MAIIHEIETPEPPDEGGFTAKFRAIGSEDPFEMLREVVANTDRERAGRLRIAARVIPIVEMVKHFNAEIDYGYSVSGKALGDSEGDDCGPVAATLTK